MKSLAIGMSYASPSSEYLGANVNDVKLMLRGQRTYLLDNTFILISETMSKCHTFAQRYQTDKLIRIQSCLLLD